MFVTINVSIDAYACHEVHFVAKFIWSRTYVPESNRHEVTFHLISLSVQNLNLKINYLNLDEPINNNCYEKYKIYE